MTFRIEKIKKKYLHAVIDLVSQLSDYKPDKKFYEEIWQSFKTQKNSFSIVVLEEDKVVGYGFISFIMMIRGGKIAYIEDIICKKEYRKKGIGKNIIYNLINYAKKNKCYKIVLQCNNSNTSFYKNCGFKINGKCMQYFI